MNERPLPRKISALISDVDGTLVDQNKNLTEGARAAVADLHARGIAFTIISSRPPRGMRMLIEPLEITAPIAGYNGGILAKPDLSVIEDHAASPEAAQETVDILSGRDVEVWVFSGNDWLVRDSHGLHIDREIRAVQFPPTVVEDFGNGLRAANKIVGVSDDFDLLTRCEKEIRTKLGNAASVIRSQRYYLDITHRLANKGDAVEALSKLMGIPMEEIAVIGDGSNDVAMFERSGLSIAMGNADPEVQKQAQFVTASNTDDGFAKAVRNYVLSDRGANS
jgi:Cof subfamily protein (haloacid dehalogenase superfamily)